MSNSRTPDPFTIDNIFTLDWTTPGPRLPWINIVNLLWGSKLTSNEPTVSEVLPNVSEDIFSTSFYPSPRLSLFNVDPWLGISPVRELSVTTLISFRALWYAYIWQGFNGWERRNLYNCWSSMSAVLRINIKCLLLISLVTRLLFFCLKCRFDMSHKL